MEKKKPAAKSAGKPVTKKVVAKDLSHLKRLITAEIKKNGPNCDLNFIDVSKVTSMETLFWDELEDCVRMEFNGDISQWDVSHVTNMREMFNKSAFNGDISKWDVSNVTDMFGMFKYNYRFNGDISNWDVSNVKDMSWMFVESIFNGDISKWDVSGVTNMNCMFMDSKFNQDISKWDISHIDADNRCGMFDGSAYTHKKPKTPDMKKFKKTPGTTVVAEDGDHLKALIHEAIEKNGPNCDLNFIDVSHVTDMGGLFSKPLFGGDISRSQFNGDISKWDVSNVEDMNSMFWESQFNGDISNWDVSKVKYMCYMFEKSEFNGDISKWNVSNVTDMSEMFYASKFNGDINQWNVSEETNMRGTFGKSALKKSKNIPKWYKE